MPPTETELKLILRAEHIDRLKDAGVPQTGTQEAAKSRRLDTLYFDTPDLALSKEGITLRIRSNGEGFRQTVKVSDGVDTGLFVRGEIEAPVSDDVAPDLALIPDDSVRRRIRKIIPKKARVGAVVATSFERTSRLLRFDDGAEVAWDLDIGEIRGGVRQLPLYELELELKAGELHHLFDLAREVRSIVPVSLAWNSKAERGYALLQNQGPWYKAESVRLHRDLSLDDTIGAVMAGCLRHLVRNEPAVRDYRHIEGIHQMRVALRRARSALGLFRQVIPEGVRGILAAEFSWLAQQFGPARDLDVFLTEQWPAACADLPPDPTLEALQTACETERRRAYDHAVATLDSQRYGEILIGTAEWIATRAWRGDADPEVETPLAGALGPFADRALSGRARKVAAKGRNIQALSLPELHELRILLKKLRYTVDFFKALYPVKKVKNYGAALANLQDIFGHINDMAVTQELLTTIRTGRSVAEQTDLAHASGLVSGWQARVLQEKMKHLKQLWQAYRKTPAFWQ